MTTKANKQEIEKQTNILREWIKPGDTLYTICEHVSRVGDRRIIRVVLPKIGDDGKVYFLHPNHAVSTVAGYRRAKAPREGMHVMGYGMDMGFDVVYNLSRKLYGDGNAIKQAWL